MNGLLREAGAILAGFLAMLAAVAATMAVAMALMGVRSNAEPLTPAYAGVLVILSGICGLVGGAVCAWLAGRAHRRATLILAVLVAAPGVWAAVTAPSGPYAWHGWAVTAMGVLGVLGGSFFWMRGRRPRSTGPRPM